jgi:hypothetical protein
MVKQTKKNIKERINTKSSIDVVEGLQDIIVGLLKGDITHEEAEQFLFNSNELKNAKYYQSLVIIEEKNK